MATSRISRGRQLGGVLAAAMFSVSGCGFLHSERTAGTVAPPPPRELAAPATTTPGPPPARPFEVRLDSVSPCSLLTPDQRAQLGFDREPLPDSDAGFGNAATCSYRNTTGKVGARLALITTESMGVWTDDTAQVEATPTSIAGFPSLVIRTPQLELSCNVAVDVAEGQHLDVLYRDDGGQPPPPLDELCEGAKRVAQEAVASLAKPGPSGTVNEAHKSAHHPSGHRTLRSQPKTAP